MKFVSWDDWMAEAPSQLSVSADALDSLPPERLFDLRWAAAFGLFAQLRSGPARETI